MERKKNDATISWPESLTLTLSWVFEDQTIVFGFQLHLSMVDPAKNGTMVMPQPGDKAGWDACGRPRG